MPQLSRSPMAVRESKPHSTLFHLAQHHDERVGWRVDANELAADFDGSLSGLGVDLAGIPYNMSEALLALPVFNNSHSGFQYVLSAPTSPATKMNEETLTYLNQGQPYELKIKKIGTSATHSQHGKYYKSFCKVYFHERRLQFAEKEQIDIWMSTRPGERILDMDSPLSYGIVDVRVAASSLNMIEFIWDSTKDCGIFIKVNCISTEFTPKKHGGEKGVPFRLQIDTYSYSEDEQPKLLNCASCQIKVFKPKGADRKHKTDRDKIEKLPQVEKEKYQPSYECTVLTEVPPENAIVNQKTAPGKSISQEQSISTQASTSASFSQLSSMESSSISAGGSYENLGSVGSVNGTSHHSAPPSPVTTMAVRCLTKDSAEPDVVHWLKANRFGQYAKLFHNFTGADLLTLTRDELVQICGLPDGLRLNNALQVKQVRPRLTLYINIRSESVFHALYLGAATCQELIEKLANLFSASPSVIVDVYLLGANNIHILVTDEVVENIVDNSQFIVEVIKNEAADQYRILLSPPGTN